MKVYLMDEEAHTALQMLCDQLHAGSDPMRDAGHKLWLLLKDYIEGPVEIKDSNELKGEKYEHPIRSR